MAKQATIKVKEGRTEEAILGFLKSLLEKGVVEDLMIPKALPSKEGFVQTLIHDASMLDGACALAPTMPVQSARVISNLSVKNLGRKVGVVLKSCEIRAIVELTKFLQVKPENLCLIGIDCPGTFEVADYAKMVQEGKGGEKLTKELLAGASKGESVAPSGYTFRTACQMCEYPVPQADIMLKLFGYPADQEIGIEIGEKFEKEVEEKGILSFSGSDPTARSGGREQGDRRKDQEEGCCVSGIQGDGEGSSNFPRSILHVCPMPQLHGGLPHLLLQGVRFQNSCF